MGSYLHGMFANDAWRAAFLDGLGAKAAGGGYGASVEQALDDLADHVEAHVDVDGVLAAAR
jgi:adenosylcobyric acid synthase